MNLNLAEIASIIFFAWFLIFLAFDERLIAYTFIVIMNIWVAADWIVKEVKK